MVGDSVYLIIRSLNVKLRVDSDGMLFISVDLSHTLGPISGMCGDFDGDTAGVFTSLKAELVFVWVLFIYFISFRLVFGRWGLGVVSQNLHFFQ